jgi:hypothetical protein
MQNVPDTAVSLLVQLVSDQDDMPGRNIDARVNSFFLWDTSLFVVPFISHTGVYFYCAKFWLHSKLFGDLHNAVEKVQIPLEQLLNIVFQTIRLNMRPGWVYRSYSFPSVILDVAQNLPRK